MSKYVAKTRRFSGDAAPLQGLFASPTLVFLCFLSHKVKNQDNYKIQLTSQGMQMRMNGRVNLKLCHFRYKVASFSGAVDFVLFLWEHHALISKLFFFEISFTNLVFTF